MLVLSYIFDNTWFSDAAINFGSALALFSPLLLAGNWLEKRLGQVESTQNSIRNSQEVTSSRVSELGQQIQDLETSQEVLRGEVMERITSARDADRDVLTRISSAPTRQNVARAVNRALDLNLIAHQGFRIPLQRTELYLRFSGNGDPEQPLLTIQIEDVGARYPKVIRWEEVESTSDFLMKVTKDVQARDMYPGDENWHPERVLPDLSDALIYVFHKVLGGESTSRSLGPVFQLFRPQWAIGEEYLACTDGLRPYDIHLSRLDEMDWERHMTEKGWVDEDSFRDAFFTAIELERRVLRPSRHQ